MSPSDDNLVIQVAKLEARMEAITERLDKVTAAVESLNTLAIQGRMAIIVLVAIGSVVGWVAAQIGAVKGLGVGR